jgi:oligoribonuclease
VDPKQRREELLQLRAEPDERIVLLDMETSGLIPEEHDILEIGAIVLTADLDRIPSLAPDERDIHVFHRLVRIDPQRVRASAQARVLEMHKDSGLLDDLDAAWLERTSKSIEEVEGELVGWLQNAHAFPARTAVLGGSSVHFDRTFIVRHMPTLDVFLHYRMLDVSAIRECYRRWVDRDFPRRWKAEHGESGHRVRGDIENSLAELRFFREQCFRPEPPTKPQPLPFGFGRPR